MERVKGLKNFFLPWIFINLLLGSILTLTRFLIYRLFAPSQEIQEFSAYLGKAFFMGLRMDLAVLAYANVLPVLSLLLIHFFLPFFPHLWKKWLGFSRSSLFLMFMVILFASIGEIIFYTYFNDRYNTLAMGFLYEDIGALLRTLFTAWHFWFGLGALFGLGLCVHFVLTGAWKKISQSQALDFFTRAPWWQRLFCCLTLVFMAFVLARGNLHLYRPISVEDTDISPSLFINKLAKTSVYSFIDAYQEYHLSNVHTFNISKEMGYENREQSAFADFSKRPLQEFQGQSTLDSLKKILVQKTGFKTYSKGEEKKPHVVLILMESLGAHWLTHNSPSFNLVGPLENHLKEDYWFQNFFPSANGSFPSLAALIANLPDISGKPLPYFLDKNTVLPSAGAKPFKKNGYETRFVYGSSVSWRNFMEFASHQFFDVIEGASTIQSKLKKWGRKKITTHDWGIADEHFFDYLYELLTQSQKPQLIVSGSSSNHPPFIFPKSYKPVSLQWPQHFIENLSTTTSKSLAKQRLQIFRYACDKLAQFLDKIKNSSLAHKTIVVVSADHNFKDVIRFSLQKEFMKQISVPLYLYIPKAYKPSFYSKDTFASHIDIFPTLYNLIFSNEVHVSVGKDIFSRKIQDQAFALNSNVIANQHAAVVSGKYYFVWDKNQNKYVKEMENKGAGHSAQLEKQRKALLSIVGEFIKKASQWSL